MKRIVAVLTGLGSTLVILNFRSQALADKPHTIVSFSGEVLVKHKGSVWSPVKEGESLYSGDLLYLREKARATVLCNTGGEWNVPEGRWEAENGCRGRIGQGTTETPE
ncbi:MAG: hypothetical protein AB4038_18720 [Prochloraceae cyanobacterium]